MLPHLETTCMLKTMDHQQTLREAAKARLAANSQATVRPAAGIARGAWRFAAVSLAGFLTRSSRSTPVQTPPLLAGGHAEPAGQGA